MSKENEAPETSETEERRADAPREAPEEFEAPEQTAPGTAEEPETPGTEQAEPETGETEESEVAEEDASSEEPDEAEEDTSSEEPEEAEGDTSSEEPEEAEGDTSSEEPEETEEDTSSEEPEVAEGVASSEEPEVEEVASAVAEAEPETLESPQTADGSPESEQTETGTAEESPKAPEETETPEDESETPVTEKETVFSKISSKFNRVVDAVNKALANEKFVAFKAKFFTSKTFRIAALCAKIGIIALCVLQVVIWAVALGDSFKGIWSMILELNAAKIIAAIATIAFLLVFYCQFVAEIASLIWTREIRYGCVSTLFSFFVVTLFLKSLVGEGTMLDRIDFGGLFWFLIAIMLILAVVRFFRGDMKKRLVSILFCFGAGVAAIVLYAVSAGNFLDFSALPGMGLKDVDLFAFFSIVSGGAGTEGTAEYLLSTAVAANPKLYVPIATLLVFFAKMIPCFALSLLQYCILILIENSSKQYYQSKALQTVAIMLTAASIIQLIGSVWLLFAFELFGVSVQNLVLTLIMEALLIVCAVMPWRLYLKNGNRYIAKLKKIAGGK